MSRIINQQLLYVSSMNARTIYTETRLSRDLAHIRDSAEPQHIQRPPVPVDAFNLALRKWIDGERIELTRLASELGIGRATLYRWVGSREQLLGEVIWYLCERLWKDVVKSTSGHGPSYIADVAHEMMQGILAAQPLRQFLNRDPEYALRILTSKTSVVQGHVVEEVARELASEKASGAIAPSIDIENLAYLVVRTMESFVYSDQIAGRKPDIEIARKAIHALVSA